MAGPKELLKSAVRSAAGATGLYLAPRGGRSPIPDVADLRRRTDWRSRRNMVGMAGAALDEQLAFIDALLQPEIAATLRARDVWAEVARANGEHDGMRAADVEMLYAVVRARRPARIVQIGTCVLAGPIVLAAADAGYAPEHTVIDADPKPYVLAQAGRGGPTIVRHRPQTTLLDMFTRLREGDLLFIHSDRAMKAGGELNRLVLEVLPLLAPGVLVHIHNINFPYDYGRAILEDDVSFSKETSLLHAFLIGNTRYRIRASLSMLHYGAREALKARLPHYAPASDSYGLAVEGGPGEWPSSLWLQRTGEG